MFALNKTDFGIQYGNNLVIKKRMIRFQIADKPVYNEENIFQMAVNHKYKTQIMWMKKSRALELSCHVVVKPISGFILHLSPCYKNGY